MDDTLRSRFKYDPETGIITGQDGRPRGREKKGYLVITTYIKGRYVDMQAHRLGWFLHYGEWPDSAVDHINRDKLDNRLSNLRLGAGGINQQNRTADGYHTYKNGWRVHIRINGKRHNLSCFPDEETAKRVYTALKREFHPGCSHWGGEQSV